jgi:uncharacterized protein (TIGR03437 family)
MRRLLPVFLLLLSTYSIGSAQAIRNNPGFYVNELERNDDGSSAAFQLGFQINFFGRLQNTVFVNNNGNITFDQPLPTYNPQRITETGRVMIAPFWADVDTTAERSSVVTYGRDSVNGRPAFAANWRNVGYFDRRADKLNSFQVVLIDRSDITAGAFDIEFNYENIEWDSGQVSVGRFARAGYSNGSTINNDGNFELPGSGLQGAFLNSNPDGLIRRSLNSTIPGRLVFLVRAGGVASTLTLEPATLLFKTDSPEIKPALQRINVSTNGGSANFTVTTDVGNNSLVNWMFAGPQTGRTPAQVTLDVSTENLTVGGYAGRVRVTPQGAAGGLGAQDVNVILAVGRDVPIVERAGVVNAASFLPGVLSPGGIFTVFGASLAGSTQAAPSIPVSDILNNVRVLVNNQPMTIFFVSPTQINAMVPHNYQPVQDAVLRVVRNGIQGPPVRVDVVPAVPGVFQYGGGNGVVVNQDGSVNGPTTPETPGRAIVIYLTGLGPVSNAPNPGAASPSNPLAVSTRQVRLTIGNKPAEIAFAGMTPGSIGLAQINAVVPAGLPPGGHALVVSVDGYPSAPVIFYVK